MKRVLFICKKNETYGFISYQRKSSGLYNSTKFVSDAIGGTVIEVNDNNDIDREVTRHTPDVVVIEALWVVPEKFDVLKRLHPKVKWYVHIHSNIPFLANEGCAIDWMRAYAAGGVGVITNSKEAETSLTHILGEGTLTYLPNVYPAKRERLKKYRNRDDSFVNIGCFGAIRPMKNQLIQALAALEYAADTGRRLYFHINSSRVETNGDPILKNLYGLFRDNPAAQLFEHRWMEHSHFLKTLSEMDIGMQVSLSETFNIVTADMVSVGLPIVTSSEVWWVAASNKANPGSVADIKKALGRVEGNSILVSTNQTKLHAVVKEAKKLWRKWSEK